MKPETTVNYFDADTFKQEEEVVKTPVVGLYRQYKAVLWFVIGMVVMGSIATHSYQSKYAGIVSSIEEFRNIKEEVSWNNSQILNFINRNQELNARIEAESPKLLKEIEDAITPTKQKVVNH